MANCAKCNYKLDEGITVCPGCGGSLVRPGAFLEVLGWVLAVVSSVPIIIGEKTLEQAEYVPMAVGVGMLVVGVVMVLVARGRSRGAESPVAEPGPDGSRS